MSKLRIIVAGPLSYPEGYPPQAELVAKKWFIRIERSPTVGMLREIGLMMRDAPVSEANKELARSLYGARLRQLKEAGQ